LLGAALTASCEKVTVVTATVASVQLTPPEASLIEGDSVQLSVVITDSQGNRLSGREIIWSTDEPEVAAVDGSGMVVGLREGVTAVRAFVETASASSAVTVLRGPTVGVSRPDVIFQGSADGPDPAPITVAIFNDGAGALQGLVTSVEYVTGSAGWLEATLAGKSAPTSLRLSARADALEPGTYVALVRVASAGSSTGAITVTFDLSDSAPVIGLSESTVEFERGPGDATVAQAAVTVMNLGSQALTGLGAGVTYGAGEPTGWLVASLSPTTAPATLSLSASSVGLVAGAYTATVDVLSPVALNSPQSVIVSLVITEPPPTIVLSGSSLDFNVQEGAGPPASRSVNVDNGGGGVLSGLTVAVDYGTGPAGWVDATLDEDTAPTALRVAVDPTGRAPGRYAASVAVSSPVAVNSPQTVAVTLTVGDRSPTIVLSESLVRFAGLPGGADPAPVTVAVTNGGGGDLAGLVETVSYDDGQAQGWLQAALLATEAPTDLELRTVLGDLASGNYGATVAVSSPQASNSPQTIRVDLVMGSPPSAPSGLSAVAVAPDQVDLAWTDNSGDEDRFSVERSAGGANAWQEVATVGPDVVAYSDRSVTEGTSYDYRILACAGDLCSPPSSAASVTTPTTTTAPEAPSGLGATAVGPNHVDRTITGSSPAPGSCARHRPTRPAPRRRHCLRQQRRRAWERQPFHRTRSTWTGRTTATTRTDSPSSAVRAVRVPGRRSPPPAPTPTRTRTSPSRRALPPPPVAPSGLSATAVSHEQVDLAWTDNSPDEDSFRLERRVNGGDWSRVTSTGPNVTAHSDGVSPETEYSYRVQACGLGGCSDFSNVATATTPSAPTPPAAVTDLNATVLSESSVRLSWTDNSDNEEWFEIRWRRVNQGGSWNEADPRGPNTTQYTVTGLQRRRLYEFQVRACNVAGCSPRTSVQATTPG
jgi:hypothetical protein